MKLSDWKTIRIAKISDNLILWTEDKDNNIQRWELVKENTKQMKCLKSLERQWAR